MKFAVIGGGNTGQAISGYLSLNGNEVKLYTSNIERAQILNEKGLAVSGVYSGSANLEAYTNMADVVPDAEVVIVSTTADGHKNVIKKMKGHLQKNQIILFIPGYWGALECRQVLGSDIEDKNLIVAETSAQPFISKADDKGNVEVRKIKNNVMVSTLHTNTEDRTKYENLLEKFPHLNHANNVLMTSLNNTNVVVHVPIVAFNASRIDSAQNFEFYPDGVSKLTVDYIENLDKERMEIADLFNIETKDILSLLNEFYGTSHDSLFEALPSLFPDGAGPNTLNHRYFTEDIPFGLVPIMELAKKLEVDTVYTEKLVHILSLFSGNDYLETGVSFNDLSIEEILQDCGLEK
ncbi:NAD/NADP-dependent octopine/nopaline dehydrogenase family protein [Salinicoccus sp. YB14-2]|uniref:NAD/NADP-dependent octopine/nopaline dehydrogenase family protein n=1 Tax=Salinicoccus sp. YB14-2 TaxID=1572701 RepID=UPI00068F1AFA|nr:NAD/NADP-dependent octopine/nopaline dehydrogenase family protein [Salinicoccus sp. YB14-2]